MADSTERWMTLGQAFAAHCPEMCYLALYGDLGTGKTTFVKGLGRAWGIETVKSPTFNLLHVHHGQRTLLHVDAYRLNNDAALDSLALTDFLVPPFCVAVEWPENLKGLPYTHTLFFSIERPGVHRVQLKQVS